MPILPQPKVNPQAGPPTTDKWADASFYDVTLVQLASALISSGNYAPGPLVMNLAVAGAAEMMYQTGRWVRPAGALGIDPLTPEEAALLFRDMGRGK